MSFPRKRESIMKIFHKKTILIILAYSAGFLLLAALGWLLYFNAQFSVYQDSQYKFSIKYPKSWKVVIHPQANVAVVFLRPKDTALDALQENFNVTIQPMPVGIINLSQFSAAIKTQMTGVFGKSIKIVEDRPLQWGWREGHKMSIEAPKPDHLRMVNAWLLSQNQVYIMTFLGDMNKYAKDGLFVNEMIRSLKLQ
jgi:hypothetical protein